MRYNYFEINYLSLFFLSFYTSGKRAWSWFRPFSLHNSTHKDAGIQYLHATIKLKLTITVFAGPKPLWFLSHLYTNRIESSLGESSLTHKDGPSASFSSTWLDSCSVSQVYRNSLQNKLFCFCNTFVTQTRPDPTRPDSVKCVSRLRSSRGRYACFAYNSRISLSQCMAQVESSDTERLSLQYFRL
jgi:hypothetical protein